MYLSLRCDECENTNCEVRPCSIGRNVGCSRLVTEEQSIKYYHYMKEVLPFLKGFKPEAEKREYIEILNFLQEIYAAPVGRELRFKEK